MTDARLMLEIGLASGGVLFFVAGLVGLLRLPDVYTRLHALTKADNVGLGLLAAAVGVHFGDLLVAGKLLLLWLAVLAVSALISYLIANTARRRGQQPWTTPTGNQPPR